MTLLSILVLCFTLSFSILLASSPLFLGLWILFLALSMALFLSILTYSWLGFFMFLIYVGGLLVMFAYFVALAPNHLMEGKSMILMTFFTYPAIMTILMPMFLISNSDFSYSSHLSITSLLFNYNILIYIFLALILFLALVAVVKISTISSGPLRPYS